MFDTNTSLMLGEDVSLVALKNKVKLLRDKKVELEEIRTKSMAEVRIQIEPIVNSLTKLARKLRRLPNIRSISIPNFTKFTSLTSLKKEKERLTEELKNLKNQKAQFRAQMIDEMVAVTQLDEQPENFVNFGM